MRKKHVIFTLLLITATFFLMGVKGAELPEVIKRQIHTEKECGVKVIKNRNVEDIRKLKETPDYAKIIVIQASYEKINDELAQILMNWVTENGGSVWFYDSRLAHYFGMENSPINPSGTLSRAMNGEFGDNRKHPGMAINAGAFGNHPLLTGVQGAVVFILKIGEDQYSAVKTGADVKPILKASMSGDEAISAIREVGNGKIVLKTLLWPDQLDGGRLQVNMLEYCAGFPIPQITEKDSPVTDAMLIPNNEASKWETVDVLTLEDGRTLWGKITNSKIDFEGADKSSSYKLEQIKSIKVGKGGQIDTLTDIRSKEHKGFIYAGGDGFLITTPSGTKIKLEKRNITNIIFNTTKEGLNNEELDTKENS